MTSPFQTLTRGEVMNEKTLWNVRLSVVDLVRADSDVDAVADLTRRLRAAGFDVYEGDAGDAFESEADADSTAPPVVAPPWARWVE